MVRNIVLSLGIGWFGALFPVLLHGFVRTISWGLRLLIPDWIVHVTLALLLLAWIALMLDLLYNVWVSPRSRITMGHADHHLDNPRLFSNRLKSLFMKQKGKN